jgi:hypothetical protein
MGRPAHYSLEIVARCRNLIAELEPIVRAGLKSDKKEGGPLTTTFLLAMATPMIGLPIERIFKAQEGNLVADDSELNPDLSNEVRRVLDGKLKLEKAPFSKDIDWRLLRNVKPFNIAVWESAEHFAALSNNDARVAANSTPADFMLRHLRNALAHGGIVYFDGDGRMNDTKAEMLGFVSAKKDYDTGEITGLHISRMSEADFLRFLLAWADWIAESGVSKVLDADPPLAA